MKVLVTPRSFGKYNPELFTRLEDAGCTVIRNESGRTLDETQMIGLIAPCEGVIVGVDPLNARVLEAAPGLRAISKYGVGLDNVDLEVCRRRGIIVTRTEHATDGPVADYAFSLMLGVARRIALGDRNCRSHRWIKETGVDMFGRTIGIIGLGGIGRSVARRARGFDMRILASDPQWDESFASELGIARASVDEICSSADFITLHCVLNESTRGLISRRHIEMMKKNAVLVNTARGGLVDEDALLEALEAKRIFGAGIDVFEHEPPKDRRWYELDNVILGAHCASSTFGCSELMGSLAVENLLRSLKERSTIF